MQIFQRLPYNRQGGGRVINIGNRLLYRAYAVAFAIDYMLCDCRIFNRYSAVLQYIQRRLAYHIGINAASPQQYIQKRGAFADNPVGGMVSG